MNNLYRQQVACGMAGVLAAAPLAAQSPARPTAFVDVAVVPMDREQVLSHQTVVVQGDRIVALGPVKTVAVPARATRVDGRGKFLIPGLADMHAHVPLLGQAWGMGDTSPAMPRAKRALLLYLANGVTTLRVMGYAGSWGLDLRNQIARGAVLGPRLSVGAGPVDGMVPDSAIRFVEAARKAGYEFIKVHGSSGEGIDSAVAAAHRVGLPVAGHPPGNSIQRAIIMGFVSVEHQIGLRKVDDARRYVAALKQAGVWVCPTLVQHDHGRSRLKEATWPERRYMVEEFRKVHDNPRYPNREGLAAPGDTLDTLAMQQWQRAIEQAMAQENEAIKALHDAGVGLLLGSDAPIGGVAGFEAQRELGALVEAGLTPYEALLTGTRNAAAYFGTLDSAGTVAVQKRADLVLLSDNPLVDIRHAAQVVGVMQGGRWLPRTALDRLLKPIEGLYP